MRLGSSFIVFLLVCIGCKSLSYTNITRTLVIPGLPNLNKFTKYEFDLSSTSGFKFKNILLQYKDKTTTQINFIDIVNRQTQKGFRLQNFGTLLEKGKYSCTILINNISEDTNEIIIIKTSVQGVVQNTKILKIEGSKVFHAK